MKRESLKQQAYHILKTRITSCAYAPGCQLSEEMLQQELGMSRTPIRDALSRLEQEGLVSIHSKKGIEIAKLKVQDLNMIFELRELLECRALLHYGNLLPEEQLYDYFRRFSRLEPGGQEDYYRLDDAFHGMLMSVVPNRYMLQSYQAISNQNNRFRVLTGYRTERRLMDTSKEHCAILSACIQKNWPGAAQAMRDHLHRSRAAAFALLLEQGADGDQALLKGAAI